MGTLDREALEIAQALLALLSEEEPFLAQAAECDYFRSLYRSLKKAPEPPPSPPLPPVELKPKLQSEPVRLPPPPQEAASVAEPPPPTSRAPEHFIELRLLFSKIAPQMRILDEVPSDSAAKLVSERWKTRNQAAPFSLLTHQEPTQHRLLLEHLAQALDVTFGGAQLIQCGPIESQKQWEAFLSVAGLKVVIICDAALWQLPNLLQYYREVPSHSERFLQNTPLFLLPDLSLYLKDPQLKRSLWKALCQKIG